MIVSKTAPECVVNINLIGWNPLACGSDKRKSRDGKEESQQEITGVAYPNCSPSTEGAGDYSRHSKQGRQQGVLCCGEFLSTNAH